MRILKVEKINYRRFRDFTWNPVLGEFSNEVNIFLGWNGSGKTTFSKVMRALETGEASNGCEFKIKTDSGTFFESDLQLGRRSEIRVFNEDYVQGSLNGSPTIPHIFFAGKDAVDFSVEEARLASKRVEISKVTLPNRHIEIAKNTAKLIKEVPGINGHSKELTGGATYASYNQQDFERRIGNVFLQIERGGIASHRDFLKTESLDALKKQLNDSSAIEQVDVKISIAAKWLIDNVDNINETLASTPTQINSARVDELTPQQSDWIREGVPLHFGVDPNLENCLFCNSKIGNSVELLQHFSDAVIKANTTVADYLAKIEGFTTGLAAISMTTEEQKRHIVVLRSYFDALTPALREKRNAISRARLLVKIDLKALETLVDPKPLNATEIAYQLERHYVAEQFEDYVAAKSEYDTALRVKKVLEEEAAKLQQDVNILKQKAKSTHEPAANLNRLFKVAFPHRDIEIVDNADSTGYALKRDGELCNFDSLSEGEKNFIALAYFIYSLNDAQNKIDDNGIVVIDDPVSSLDKQAIFQIFSVIVTEMKEKPLRQYFLLTHNLDFFGHLREDFKKKIERGEIGAYGLEATRAGCVMTNIPPLLIKFRSDYYYVFSVLYAHANVCDPADAHLMVNLLRRWLETFLDFKFTTSGDLRSTLEVAYQKAADQTKDSRESFGVNSREMYRFINHGSHGFPDAESTDESLFTNANIRIQEAFRLVQILDPLHYEKLCSLV